MIAELIIPFPLMLFDKKTREQHDAETDTVVEEDTRKQPVLICASCAATITDPAARISRRGSHEHAFFNPYGIVYDIGCFAVAPGCTNVGEPSDDFSWFPGFSWQVTCCRACQTHLGWHFVGGGERFFGLILERLAEGEREP